MGIIDFLVIIPSLKINIDVIMIYEINYLITCYPQIKLIQKLARV